MLNKLQYWYSEAFLNHTVYKTQNGSGPKFSLTILCVFVLTIFLENGEICHSDVLIYTDVILIWFQGALNNVPVVNNPGLNILLGALKGAKRNQFHQHTFNSTKRNCDR